MSLRLRLSRLFAALSPPPPGPPSPASVSLDPHPFATPALAQKVLIAGGGSANPALVVLLSTILGSEVVGMPELVPAAAGGAVSGTTSSALGAAKKARWAWARAQRASDELTFEQFEARVEAKRVAIIQTPVADAKDHMAGLTDCFASVRLGPPRATNGESGGGTRLVTLARPDVQEFEYYGSMLGEFERLSVGADKGLV